MTVTDVWNAVQQRRSMSRGAVQTMMIRLEEKGWLSHRSVGQTFLYSAAIPREEAQRSIARDLLETAFGGCTIGRLCVSKVYSEFGILSPFDSCQTDS